MSLAGELDQMETWLTAVQKSIEKIFNFENYTTVSSEGKLFLNLNLDETLKIIFFIEIYCKEADSKISSHNEGQENILSFLESVRR